MKTDLIYVLIADGITGLVFDPFTPVVDVTFAEKN